MSGCEATPEVKKIIRAMAKNRVEAGHTDAYDIVDAIHHEIKDHTPLWKSEIADIVSGYGEVRKPTAEELQIRLTALRREMRDLSRTQDVLAGKIDTDAPKIKARTSALEGQIADLTRRIENNLSTATNKGQAIETPEILKLKARRDALKAELNDMQPSPPATKPEDPAIRENKTRKASLKRQIDELEHKLKTGDFDKPRKRTPVYDEQAHQLEADRDALKLRVDRMVRELERKNQSLPAQLADRFLAFRRAVILSSVHTLGKLTAAASMRTLTTPTEEAIGSLLRLVPGVRGIDARAPREGGGLSAYAEGQAVGHTLSKQTAKDMATMARHGTDSLSATYGKDHESHYPVLDIIGQIHGALKVPAKRNEVFRAVEKRAAHLTKQLIADGMSPAEVAAHIASDKTQAMLLAKAYEDGQRAILMSDNAAVSAWRMLVGYAKRAGAEGSMTRAFGGTAGRVGEYLFPIVKIPTNFFVEASSYGLGGAKALGQIIAAKGVENLTPDQADYVMRNLKKQAIGSVGLYIGFMNPDAFGGYYDSHKRKEGEPEFGGARIWGYDIPRYLLHNPLLEMLQLGATIRRIADGHHKGEGTIAAGAYAGAKGLVGEVPFFDTPIRVAYGLSNADSASRFLGEQVRNAFIPPDIQRIAKAHDHADKRKPAGFIDAIKVGVPGLREEVPTKR